MSGDEHAEAPTRAPLPYKSGGSFHQRQDFEVVKTHCGDSKFSTWFLWTALDFLFNEEKHKRTRFRDLYDGRLDEDGWLKVSHAELGARASMSTSTVKLAVKMLVLCGLLEVRENIIRRQKDGRPTRELDFNFYRIHPTPQPPKKQAGNRPRVGRQSANGEPTETPPRSASSELPSSAEQTDEGKEKQVEGVRPAASQSAGGRADGPPAASGIRARRDMPPLRDTPREFMA